MKTQQQGFTLIELMVALALGLVVVAAATMLFLTGYRSSFLQQGMADIQDDANFGLNYLARDIRHANLNDSKAIIDDTTKFGGIVFTSGTNGVNDPKNPGGKLSNIPANINVDAGLLSKSEVSESNVGYRNDQLTIQYKPQYTQDDNNTPLNEADDKAFGGFDCEGTRIEIAPQNGQSLSETPKHIIVERYYVNKDNALVCDAGWYAEEGDSEVHGLGKNSAVIMRNVDYFHVMLETLKEDKFQYYPLSLYARLNFNEAKPRILAVQLGVLTRSNNPVSGSSLVTRQKKYNVLGKDVTLVDESHENKHVRQVVSQNVALRNAFGERGI